jgi:phosphoribosyl-ATP pyrophosphohydrolase
LQIGQEIEYKVKEYNAKRQPIIKHGVVRHITNRMLVIQLDQYRDTIQVADLISGQVELVKPAMPDGLVLVNRIKRDDPKRPSNTKGTYTVDHRAAKRYIENRDKRSAQTCGSKPLELLPQKKESDEMARKKQSNWAELMPQVEDLVSQGWSTTQIAEKLDMPYSTIYGHLKGVQGQRPETDKSEPDIKCPEENVYTARINARLSAQIAKGMAKYGQPLEHNLASQSERLEHLAQELTDGLMYIEWIRDHGNHGGPLFGLPDVDWQSHGWTIPGQIKKVFEEAGEVAEAIAEQRPMEVVREALDTIQTCKTLISMVLARETRIDIDELLDSHRAKLTRKGYIREEE